ncbi:MAG TPA: aminotransferase class I/II-fold pyridoxal phosphate-dependent enzyme [Acidimicrobiales bacterium]|nr:aminotransferase class I/II-fold pyridoxal phosphate-dependent enzyme [Acidimicrobiales bacterium]
MSRLYLSPPDVGPAERDALLAAFDGGWIAPVGPDLDAFEREVARLAGVGHAAAVSSGTAALHLALLLSGLGPGDEVLVPTLTFVATANAVGYVGARPVFVDSDAATWQIDPALVAETIEARARTGRAPAAVVTVDLYGQCADADPVLEVCAAHDVVVIEDAAEALGATYRDRPAGSLGRMGVFSFNGNKVITTSGGGMLVSDDAELVARARHLATQAREPVVHYEHTAVGFNYRLSNLLAALGRAQLASLDRRIARRRAIKQRYRDAFAELDGISFMPDAAYGRPINWLTVVLVDPVRTGCTRESLRLRLEDHDIEARPAWKPLHLQPVYAGYEVVRGDVAEGIFDQGLCLPSGSSMSDADQDRVIEVVRAAVQG